MTNEFIVKYCESNYPNEVALIARSMINYYSLRNKDGKTDDEFKTQEKIFSGVISLFKELSRTLSFELNVDDSEIFEQLFLIHIKT